MSVPNRISPATNPPPLSAAEERKAFQSIELFLVNPDDPKNPRSYIERWKNDRDFRLAHSHLTELHDALERFLSRDSRLSVQKLQKLIETWLVREDFAQDPLNGVFLKNIRRQLGQFQNQENSERAAEVLALLPPEPVPAEIEAPAPAPAPEGDLLPPKRLVVGIELENDTVPLAIMDFAGIPVSALAMEKSQFTLKGSAEFPVGPWIGMVRVGGGTFSAKNIPGSGGESGAGWRAGADFALVDPYAKSHDRAGWGLELTGIHDHAGEERGAGGPSPVLRLHLFRESDLTFRVGDKVEIGLNTFLNHQDSYFILGNDTSLLPGDPNNPLSTSGSLFALNPRRMATLSARYYLEGSPSRETAEDQNQPFRPGEAGPKLGQLWTGQLINFNRRQDIPAFANTQVLFGTFWPQGMEASRAQFNTISTGLTLYSLQDGWTIAGNARLRGEMWRREKGWLHKGLVLGADAVWMGYHLFYAATAQDDPPSNQTLEEFSANPGSVRDFRGRRARMSVILGAWELGLSALDASGQAGNIGDEDKTRYLATSWTAAGLGLVGVLFSGPLSGNPCLESGKLLRCGFPGNEEKYFREGINANPGHMRSIENQYLVSTAASSLLGWGVTRLLQPLLLDEPGKGASKSKSSVAKSFGVSQPYLQMSVGDGGGQLVLGGKF